MISAVGPQNLLIVDDERAQLQTLKDIFTDEGFEVCACATFEDALDRCRDQSFSVAILDLRLGARSGIELLARIRQVQPGIRTIIHTAYGSFDSAKEAVNLRVFAYVEKLGHPAELVKQVHRAVQDLLSEALTQSEQRYRSLVDSAPLCIHEIDLSGQLMSVNPAGLQICGIKNEADLVGREYLDGVEETDRARIEALMKRAFEGESSTFEVTCRVDGQARLFLATFSPIVSEGGTVGRLMGTAEDITDRRAAEASLRESEEKFRVLTERCSAIVLIARAERIVYGNPMLAAVTHYSNDELLQMNLLDIVHPDYRELVAERHRGRLRGETHPNRYEIKIVTKDGEDRWLDLSAELIDFEARPAVLATCINITERKLSEKMLREMQAQLAHVSRVSTMGEMVAGIAHEVNQPLAAIANFALACQNSMQATDFEYDVPIATWLQEIHAQSVRCGDIIRGLRDFVKKSDDARQLVDLNLSVRDSIALIGSELRHQSVVIDCRLPNPGPQVHASQVQLQQVLVNLLRNACDATSTAIAPEIGVHVECQNGRVCLTVVDNGSGVEESQRKKLFDAFYTTKPDGMGMGLAIIKSIVEAHGGSVRFEPGIASGSKFHIELPAVEATEENEEHVECRIN